MATESPSKTWKERLLYTQARDDRSRMVAVVNNAILHLHPSNVPAPAIRFTYTWGLGGIATVLAAMLGLTGLLLMFRYDARVDYAYTSIQVLEAQVMFGSLFRAVHHWSANLLVVTAFLHLLRVTFTAGYKQGRTMNWLIGIGLLVLVLAANFTGYLLPWDQLAYWAITVSTTLLSYIPRIGEWLSRFLLGGPQVGQGALSNFFALHVVVIPLITVLMMAYHFWKVRKNGGLSQPIQREAVRVERLTTIPHLVRREAAVGLTVLAAVITFAMWVPAPLQQIANPLHSPNPAKAAWYFAGLQELLLHMHPLPAIALVALVLVGLISLPWLDRKAGDIGLYFRSPVGKLTALIGAVTAAYLIPALVVLDEYWLDLPGALPDLPDAVTSGWLPFTASILGLLAIYGGLRLVSYKGRKANHSEALLGLFTFLMTSLVALTIIGVFLRGANMALVLTL